VTLEIERKFLLDGPPAMPEGAEALMIEQGYLPPDAGPESPDHAGPDALGRSGSEGRPHSAQADDHTEGRLRRITTAAGEVHYQHTIKEGAGLVRRETNRSITAAEFESLWPRTAGRRLTKTRWRVREGDVVWEIDHIEDPEVDLAEVELPRADAQVEIPPWLSPRIVREVTDDPAFTNYELAMRLVKEGGV